MSETLPMDASNGYKDRHGGLIGFGILVILIGIVCAMVAPLMLLAAAMPARANAAPMDLRTMLPVVIMYVGMATLFIWLGIGSIMAKRWARALLLIVGWMWLVCGIIGVAVTAVVLPNVFNNPPPGSPQIPPAIQIVGTIVALAIISVIYVVVPGLLVLFYRGKNVKATCEARNPVPSWTDACPLPVLALSFLLGLGAVLMWPQLLINRHVVMPFFGRVLTGAPAILVLLLITGLWGYCAWAAYQLKPVAWWIMMTGLVVMTVSSVLTFLHVDMIEMSRMMGTPEAQLEQMQRFSFFKGKTFLLLSTVSVVPLLGYLLWVKEYFRSTP